MAGKLVESLHGEVRARATTRTPTARRCWTLIKRKAKGEEIEQPEEPEPEDVRRPDGRAARRAWGAAD